MFWALSFPWTLNNLIADWTSLLSLLLSLLLFSDLAYICIFMIPQPLSYHFTHFWSFHPWSLNETLPWRAWLGLRIPTVDSLPQTQTKHQTPRLLHYVILSSLTLRPGPIRHLRQLTVQLPTSELRPTLIHIQALHLLMFLFRLSQVLHTTTSIVLTSHPAWSTRSNSRLLPTPTIPGSYSSKRSPMSGLSKCRDPEHYFYGLSGNWEWSLRTADYWRHHFEIPLVHGHHPFHNVPIETTAPTEATRFTLDDPRPGQTIFQPLWRLLWHLGKSTTRGGWLKAWASVTRSRHFKLRRLSLLSDWTRLCTLALESLLYLNDLADICSDVLPKNQTPLHAGCVCVCV